MTTPPQHAVRQATAGDGTSASSDAGKPLTQSNLAHARRCGVLLFEARERADFDLAELLLGGVGMRTSLHLVALAPHLPQEVDIDAAQCDVLGQVGSSDWTPLADLQARFGAPMIDGLLALGLLISDDDAGATLRERDETVRNTHWHPHGAVAHMFSRWRDVDSSAALEESGLRSLRDLTSKLGDPPPHLHARVAADARIALPRTPASALSDLMQRRTTCRNFDTRQVLCAADFSAVLERVFAAQAVHTVSETAAVVKRNSPSGGGLHPVEAYLLVNRVEGVAPGLYHYHGGDHALEPLPCAEAADPEAFAALARRVVAGQYWFADAHVIVVMAARFFRSFWKYRSHAKSYRALILDVGHLSQNLYLASTELGLGAFITAAVNEVVSEEAFGLDPLREGPLAVCGFGHRAAQRETVEFDPLKRVWSG